MYCWRARDLLRLQMGRNGRDVRNLASEDLEDTEDSEDTEDPEDTEVTMESEELMDIMRSRRSIRAFRPDPLTQDQIDTLIEALLSAPSAGNLQSRQFFFVTNKELQRELVRAALGQDFIAEAPLVVVACTDARIQRRYGSRGTSLYAFMDVAASVQNAMLVAQAMGLGTCWVGAFNEEPVHALLKLPPNLRPVTMFPVGRPAESPLAPHRVSRKAAVSFID